MTGPRRLAAVDRTIAAVDAVLDEPPARPAPRALVGTAPARTFTGRCPCLRCVVRRLPSAVADALFVARLLPGAWRDMGRRR